VGDCRDGVLFYSYHENLRKLELIYSDPAQRLVGDVALLSCETAVVSDRRGSISVLSCPRLEGMPWYRCLCYPFLFSLYLFFSLDSF
jgi:splicing factor 3B subunit 3